MSKCFLKCFFVFVGCCVIINRGNAQTIIRKIIPLKNNWQFSFVNSVYKQSPLQTVNVPYTWNAQEVMDPHFNYQRASAVYRKLLYIEPSWKSKRLFLFFEGANSVADVFVNKRYVGTH